MLINNVKFTLINLYKTGPGISYILGMFLAAVKAFLFFSVFLPFFAVEIIESHLSPKRANPTLALSKGFANFQPDFSGIVRSRNSTLDKYSTPSREK